VFDRVEIVVRGGDGGTGAVSFRREKFVPLGGPDGGNGGDGGNVVIKADSSVSSLRRVEPKRLYRAVDGGNGRGQRKYGKGGNDIILTVPVGTVISYKTQIGDCVLIADLDQPRQQAVAARGGKGGFGNTHYVSSTNQAPRIAQNGEVGEEHGIILEMRLIADVGIIGYPNVGKSTLLAAASAAKPKIASYPFTTLEPVLGAVEVGQQAFILAEIPGLIGGAHLGRGLGHDFLRHIVRTRVLIHLLDGGSPSAVEDMVQVNAELGLFDSALARKSQLVAVNKMDLPQVRTRLAEMKDAFSGVGTTVHFISAATEEGLPELMAETIEMLESVERLRQEGGEKVPKKVFRPPPRGGGLSVRKDGDTFVVVAPEMERIIARVDANNPEVRWQLERQLVRAGVNRILEKAGVKLGNKVRCGKLEWEW